MIALKLAYKNLMGAGLRTLLIVFVLSLAYVMIIFMNGMYQGWDKQARIDMVKWEVGQGQLWQKDYDPYDPMTLTDAHAPVPEKLRQGVKEGILVPILIRQATAYPEGRMMGIVLKGIPENQKVLAIPTGEFTGEEEEVPAVVGSRFAKSAGLEKGDDVLVRWRDVNGTFDARDLRIVGIFSATVPTVDAGQIWVPIDRLREMTGMPGEATMVITSDPGLMKGGFPGWEFKDHAYLFKDLEALIQSKSIGGSVFYSIILALALLAVFDTQVLSIFRRQREIGTYVSMGMTRREVVGIFTVEGAMHAILAMALGALYGIPLFLYMQKTGIGMPEAADSFGVAAAERIYPFYSFALIIGTIVIVMIATTIVSFMPSRKIAKMNPNDAIRGRIQ